MNETMLGFYINQWKFDFDLQHGWSSAIIFIIF